MLTASVEPMVLAGKAGLDLRKTLEVLQTSTAGHGHMGGTIPNQVLTEEIVGIRLADLAQSTP